MRDEIANLRLGIADLTDARQASRGRPKVARRKGRLSDLMSQWSPSTAPAPTVSTSKCACTKTVKIARSSTSCRETAEEPARPVLEHVTALRELIEGELEAARKSPDKETKLAVTRKIVTTCSAVCTAVGVEPIRWRIFPF